MADVKKVTLPDGRSFTYGELRTAVGNGSVKGSVRSDGVIYLEDGYSVGIDGVLCAPGEAPTPGICCPPRNWCGTGLPAPESDQDSEAQG